MPDVPVRHIFMADDAPQFTTLLNAEFDKIWPSLVGGMGGAAFAEWYGDGRFVTSSADALAPTTTATPSLNLVLPAGFTWVQDGVPRVFDIETLLGPLPANFSGYITLSFDENGALGFATSPERPASGIGVLAYVETDAQGVTRLDVSPAQSDVIPSLPLLLSTQQTILQRLAVLESGVGGGEAGAGGDNTALLLAIAAMQKRLDDQDAIIAELSRKLGGDAPAVLRVAGESEVLRAEMQRVLASQTCDNPALSQEIEAAIVAPGVAGNNETLPDGTHTPDNYIGGSWKPVPRKRQFN